jgi:hypothetical protein
MMKKGMSAAYTGLAVTMAVGTAAWMMTEKPRAAKRRAKRLKRSAEQVISSAGVVMDELSDWMH